MRARGQRGVALLAAVILMLAVVTTMGTIFYRHQVDVAALSTELHDQQARLLALSAENWALSLLAPEMDDPQVDHLQEAWAMPMPPMPIEAGQISGCVRDLQSRLNLNSFAAWDADTWASAMDGSGHSLAGTLRALFRAAELPVQEVQVASLVDWVDGDDQTLNQWGAEQSHYDTLRPRYMVPNVAMTSVSELAVVRGYDAAMVAAVRSSLAALPEVTTINVNTAGPSLLTAMAGDQGEAFVSFVTGRRPFDSLEAFQEQAGEVLGLDEAAVDRHWSGDWVGVNSAYFQLEMRVTLGEATIDITSVVERGTDAAPEVIRRHLSRVPDIDVNALDESQQGLLRHSCETLINEPAASRESGDLS